MKNRSVINNPCEMHLNFKGELCPVCLANERDAALARIAELEQQLAEARKDSALVSKLREMSEYWQGNLWSALEAARIELTDAIDNAKGEQK